ncbi:hypothetical protein HAR52_004586, partial [Salmonella enterica subsp. enterica]|nr:hypothetical protein [Salmonella enterica subsp. enterica]
MFSHQRKQYLGVFYSLKARAIANFGVFERVRAFVGVWTTAFLSVVFYTFKTEYRRQSPLEVRYWRCSEVYRHHCIAGGFEVGLIAPSHLRTVNRH